MERSKFVTYPRTMLVRDSYICSYVVRCTRTQIQEGPYADPHPSSCLERRNSMDLVATVGNTFRTSLLDATGASRRVVRVA
jgi:hypothetical protein